MRTWRRNLQFLLNTGDSDMIDGHDYEAAWGSSGALVAALRVRDSYTQLHSDRVVGLAVELGVACRLDTHELFLLKMGACFHDIGKIGIPDQILLKPAELTDEERTVMRSHPDKGAEIVGQLFVEGAEGIATTVRHHHEHYDGEGYPNRLRGEAIPLYSRMISLADSYDAMVTRRPYNPGKTHEQAIAVIRSEAGSKLDPYLSRKFLGIIDASDYRIDAWAPTGRRWSHPGLSATIPAGLSPGPGSSAG